MKKLASTIFKCSLLILVASITSCSQDGSKSKQLANQNTTLSKDESVLIKEFLKQQYDLLYYEENALLLASERLNDPSVRKFTDEQLTEVIRNKEELKFYQKKYQIIEVFTYQEDTKSAIYQLSITSNKDFDKMFLKLYGDFHKGKNKILSDYNLKIDRVDLSSWNEKIINENAKLIDYSDSLYHSFSSIKK